MKRKARKSVGSLLIAILRWIRNIILVSMLLLLVFCAFLYFVWVKPEYERLRAVAYEKISTENIRDMTRAADTVIYDKYGKALGLINAGHYEYVSIENISPSIQQAYIAQEDRRFLSHHGVDYRGTLRAAVALLKNRGRITQGGSTITQQLVKNTYLTAEKSFSRKLAEMVIATELEKQYSKAEIMELYLNINFYGNNCYGIEAASKYYFSKSASEITVPEAAVLAGITNAPSRYEPIRHPEASLKKRNQVLRSLRVCDYITEEELQDYLRRPLGIERTLRAESTEDYLSSYALNEAVLRLMGLGGFRFRYMFKDSASQESYEELYSESYELYSKALRKGGYRIYTSLDPELQAELQAALDEGLAGFTELQENGKPALQGAAALLDNQSGYVTALVGGRGTEDGYNRGFLSVRQPGSAIKPLLDYAPAMEKGRLQPGSMIEDREIPDGPSNASGSYRGLISVREALNRSLNTVAWQLLEEIGIEYGLSYLEKMELQKLDWRDRTAKAVSIGGFTWGVTPVSMARGYGALANEGVFHKDSCIIRIEHERDGDLTGGQSLGTEAVYSKETAYMITDIMKDSLLKPYGTGYGLSLKDGMPAAGKTGTTNSSKDTWFCGYTKYYTLSVWVGYDLPRAMPGVYGASYAGKIWQDAMNRIHTGLPLLDWERPESVDYRYDPATGVMDLVNLNLDISKMYQAEPPETETESESSTDEAIEPIMEGGFSEGPGGALRELYPGVYVEAGVVPGREDKAQRPGMTYEPEPGSYPGAEAHEPSSGNRESPAYKAPEAGSYPTAPALPSPGSGISQDNEWYPIEPDDYWEDEDYDDEDIEYEEPKYEYYPDVVERNPGFYPY